MVLGCHRYTTNTTLASAYSGILKHKFKVGVGQSKDATHVLGTEGVAASRTIPSIYPAIPLSW